MGVYAWARGAIPLKVLQSNSYGTIFGRPHLIGTGGMCHDDECGDSALR